MPTGEPKADTELDAPGTTADATLPGTTVSTGAWSQFQRRMQLRREATCVAALRRAMDGGDYRTALERANELVEIDSSWSEVKLFLEDVLDGTAQPVSPVAPAEDAADQPPVTHTQAMRPRPGRVPLIVVLTLLLATLAGWSIARTVPLGVAGRWIVWLGNRIADEILPSPAPSTASPTRDALAEVPPLPPAGIVPPAPLPPETEVEGNGISQNRNASALEAPSASPPAVAQKNQFLGDTATRNPSVSERTVPDAQQRQTPLTRLQQPAATANSAGPAVSAQAVPLSGRATQSPSTSAVPLTSLNTTAQIETPVLPPAATGSRENVAVPPGPPIATVQPATPPPLTESAPPTRPPEAKPDASTSAIGTSPPPDASATSGLKEEEAARRAIDATLAAYAEGYSALNAATVRRVWPTVNEEALANAFGQLSSQRVAFTNCSVDVRGLHASAVCRGTARYVPRVGNRDEVSVSRVWQFSLRKRVDAWIIDSASIR